jgi:hypothetical protein
MAIKQKFEEILLLLALVAGSSVRLDAGITTNERAVPI